MTTEAAADDGWWMDEDDPLYIPRDRVLAMSNEDFNLYVRILEADKLGRDSEAAEAAQQAIAEGKSRYFRDPVGWAQDVRGAFLWSKQREVLRALVDHPRVLVKSCTTAGKTYLAGGIAIPWWIDVHPIGSARVMSTAPTNDQVVTNLWHEVNKAHAAGGLPGRCNQKDWWIGPTKVAYGRKAADNNPSAMIGMHSAYTLVVLDEADGLAGTMWDAAEALATNEDARILAIGNPETPNSTFHKMSRPGSGWHVITIAAGDTPNWTDEAVPESVRRELLGKGYAEQMLRKHGADGPVYVSKILAQFPSQHANTIIRERDIDLARTARPLTDADYLPVELGVDVGAGGDRSVIRLRRGIRCGSAEGEWVWRSRHDDSERLVKEILEAQRITGATSIKIDATGVGWGIVAPVRREVRRDALRTGRLCAVHGILTGQRSTEPKRFTNLRAELWWLAREFCEDRVWDLSLVEDGDPLLDELMESRWSQDAMKRTRVEPKEEVQKRLGRSPDDADALLLAYHVPAVVQEQLVQQPRWSHVRAR